MHTFSPSQQAMLELFQQHVDAELAGDIETQAKLAVLPHLTLRSVSLREIAISAPVVGACQRKQIVGAWSRQADGTLVLRWKTTDGCDAVSINSTQHQRDAGRSAIMSNQIRHNGTAAIEVQDEIVALWRQAVLGDAAARRALLWRMMPASAIEMPPAIIVERLPE